MYVSLFIFYYVLLVRVLLVRTRVLLACSRVLLACFRVLIACTRVVFYHYPTFYIQLAVLTKTKKIIQYDCSIKLQCKLYGKLVKFGRHSAGYYQLESLTEKGLQ